MPQTVFLALLLVASILLTGLYRHLALRAHILDIPVSRSAHSSPVPLGGGVVIVVLYLLGVSYYMNTDLLSFQQGMAMFAGLVVAAVGLLDDLNELKISVRIVLQLLAAAWALWWLGGIPSISLFGWTLEPSWFLNLLGLVALVWLLNLYNFMDGIDGIAGVELVFVNAMSLLLVINKADGSVALLSQLLMVLALGFLVWNWAPAKIFMGDVGSGFIGFSLGIIAIISMQQQSMTVWTWVILLGVFITDATVTLVRRFMAGERWYLGHASHAYQKAAKRFNSHSKVSIAVTGINLFWLGPLAWWSLQHPELGMVSALVAVVPLVLLAVWLEAGLSNDRVATRG
ncbi:MAG: Fuc2NAc and GlcNAc transferase [Pseudohongiellaceae bacterium]|jgi:Fuc2NAc and GlcNAc transferase